MVALRCCLRRSRSSTAAKEAEGAMRTSPPHGDVASTLASLASRWERVGRPCPGVFCSSSSTTAGEERRFFLKWRSRCRLLLSRLLLLLFLCCFEEEDAREDLCATKRLEEEAEEEHGGGTETAAGAAAPHEEKDVRLGLLFFCVVSPEAPVVQSTTICACTAWTTRVATAAMEAQRTRSQRGVSSSPRRRALTEAKSSAMIWIARARTRVSGRRTTRPAVQLAAKKDQARSKRVDKK
mmetsp:Transcript_38678/g.123989  ORF Transcript_38678/g.123989 Transcript_38678/m.123989 type:complete len:238 (+) Transcript_38678:347-1060(+)